MKQAQKCLQIEDTWSSHRNEKGQPDMREFRPQERGFGASAVFRTIASQSTTALARQLPRRERWILLLLNGRRTISDLARLTRRSELDVASTLASLLQWGYIEPVQEVEMRTDSLGGTSLTRLH
jgi:hypothetical protein